MLKIISLLKITFSIGPFKERENITQKHFKIQFISKRKEIKLSLSCFRAKNVPSKAGLF